MPFVKDTTYQTTNQNMYKPFKVKHHHRPVTCKPHVEEVRTGGFKGHFNATSSNEYKNRHYIPPAVDMIPYP